MKGSEPNGDHPNRIAPADPTTALLRADVRLTNLSDSNEA